MGSHSFWWLLTMACIVWYSTVTIYVSVKGVADIRQMVARLARREENSDSESQS